MGAPDGAAAPPLVETRGTDGAVEASGASLREDVDGGGSTCRLVYGPAEQPFRGPPALALAKGASGQNELELVVNDAGKPRVYPVASPSIVRGAPPVVPPRPTSFTAMRWPPCELAGRFVYCQAPGGTITRTVRGTTDSRTVAAKARSGTRIAAAPLGVDHSVVAFLELNRTTEGNMLQAFVALDEDSPVKLSDDGAGATTVRFVPRDPAPVAIYLDTRTAMVPVHARGIAREASGKIKLGNDSVVFVGGAPERGIDFAASTAGATSFAFVPMPKDTLAFGMATIVIHDPPKEDVPALWSLYPNGIDPAPIAAAPATGNAAWVARVRPRAKEPGSPRILELGRVDGSGAFTSFGEIASGSGVTDIALVDDGAGGVWIAYGDPKITWLERRTCGGTG